MKQFFLSLLLGGNDPLVGSLLTLIKNRKAAIVAATAISVAQAALIKQQTALAQAKAGHAVAAGEVVNHVQLKGV